MAQTFFANYPVSGSAGGSNPSVGPTGAPAPVDATEIGFIDSSGNLQGVSATNPLPITIESEVGTLNTNIAQYGGVATSLGQKVSASSVPVVIASDQSTLPISAASLPLPTGASTSALQTTGNTSLASILANQTNGTQETTIVGTVPLPTGAATSALQTTGNTSLSSILADLTNGTQVTNITGTVPLPTGASTSALQTTGNTSLASILANQTNGTQTVTGTGTAGTPATGVLTVQGITSGTPIPVSGTVTTSTAVNSNATFSGSISVTTTEASTAAPANAVGVVFEAESGNAVNIRWGVSNSATAILSTTSGVLMEPGRSIDFLPIGTGTYLHYIATAAGINTIDIQWILSH